MKRITLVLTVLAISGCASMTPRQKMMAGAIGAAVVVGMVQANTKDGAAADRRFRIPVTPTRESAQ